MREQLLAEINELERQVLGYTDQLEQTDERTAKWDAINAELKKTEAKLEAKREELTAFDGAEQAAQEQVVETFESLTVPGSDDTIPLAYLLTTDLIPLEDKMSIITSAFQNKLANAAIVKSSLEAENGRLQTRIEVIETDNIYLTKRNDELDLKAADLESKLHNAGVQLEELKEENSRKDSEISKLRDQLSKGAQPTNAKVESVETMAEGLAKRPAIYNVRWESELGRTHKLANLAETDEEIRFHYFNEGIYRVLTDEELLQFRKEKEAKELEAAAEAAKLAEEAIHHTPLVTPPSFRIEEESNVSGLPMDANGTVRSDDAPASWGELKALEARIEARLQRLEQSQIAVA